MLICCYKKELFWNIYVKCYLAIGRVNQNCEPLLLGAFLTPTSPFRLLTRFLTIANPNPLPFFSEALASAVLKNLSKITGLSKSEIPLPESVMLIKTLSSLCLVFVAILITEFSSLYLKALSIRLVKILSSAFYQQEHTEFYLGNYI